eukprot:evm.model.scf_49.9 EVM.evm.TU.scf_49.9   scf_49:112444-114203(+)
MTILSSRLIGNAGTQGGGVYAGQDVALLALSSTFASNSAADGGGLQCEECQAVAARALTFFNNTARSGGGASLVGCAGGATFNGSRFLNNTAFDNGGGARHVECSLEGGGGLCVVTGPGNVTLRACSLGGNAAGNGGGLFARHDCEFAEGEPCGRVLLTGGTAFEGNVARSGGGGALHWKDATGLAVRCSPSAPVYADGQGNSTGVPLGCASWQGNRATQGGYGDVSATGAHALGLESPAAVFNYSSDTPIPALLTIEDYYGQVVSGGLPEATTLIRVETADAAQLEGQTSLPTVRGRAEFTGLTMKARQGSYTLRFLADDLALDAMPVTVSVRRCARGEVRNEEGDKCTTCGYNTFSFNPDNHTCDECPRHAQCPDLTAGNILIPDDGYWHSHPNSPQVGVTL